MPADGARPSLELKRYSQDLRAARPMLHHSVEDEWRALAQGRLQNAEHIQKLHELSQRLAEQIVRTNHFVPDAPAPTEAQQLAAHRRVLEHFARQ